MRTRILQGGWLMLFFYYVIVVSATGVTVSTVVQPNSQGYGLNISSQDVQLATAEAEENVLQKLQLFEAQIYEQGSYLQSQTPAWFMSVSHRSNPSAKNVSWIALQSEEATLQLTQKYELSRERIAYSLPNVDIRGTKLHSNCPLKVDFPCRPRKYRAYNGYCNNVQRPMWGSANSRYLRYLMPHYADGVSSPRMASDGQFLPSSRKVSLAMHFDVDKPHSHLMALTAVWAELISKDISHSPQFAGFNQSALKCCNVTFDTFHAECYPIRIDGDDPYYSKFGDNCQEYVRTSVAPRVGCTLGPREQINQQTSFLDGSFLYGTSKARVQELRLFQQGLLRTQVGPGGELMLPNPDRSICRENEDNLRCFKGGDDRVNENIGIATMLTLWLREHNRIARELGKINPQWSDETIFQETRRIVIGELQHITYNEFLPVVVGQDLMRKYGLHPQTSGYYSGYDINTNAGILNGVATAALWFFASMTPKMMPLYDAAGRKVAENDIAGSFYSPFDLYRNGILDQILRGMLRGKAQSEDNFINDAMTNRMFEDPNTGSGLDLAGQLIQQGRDHGVPGYVFYRELCGLGKARNFSDLKASMSPDAIARLQYVYKTPEDIDLFTGGLAEYPLPGAVLGHTFGCLMGIQFQKLRNGDRMWYENDLPPSSFTLEQLQEIRKSSLARIICDNSNAVADVQPSVFLERDPFLNAPMHCDGIAIKRLDLTKWYYEPVQETGPPNRNLQQALEKAKNDLKRLHNQELELWRQHVSVDPLSPAGTAFAFNKPKARALEIANASFLLQFATDRFIADLLGSGPLQDREDLLVGTRDVRSLVQSLQSVEVDLFTELPKVQKCAEHELPCDHTSIFRTISGWCNNLRDPKRGSTFQIFKRLAPAEYNDGLKEPRVLSVKRIPLPSARLVSTTVHDDISVPHGRNTLALMQFGQLLDHDITHSPMNKGFQNSILKCNSCNSSVTVHPECWPIPVPNRDPYFPRVNASTGEPFCLAFTRSLPGQLTFGQREQLNQVTAYLDASFVYGSDVCEARKLRSFVGGKLNTTAHPGGSRRYKDLLPETPFHPECKAPSGLCFEAGDLRASEQPGLAAIHTIWMREHNRLADELELKNPNWDDERIYQQARRILGAVTQKITYAEFLPRVLGLEAIHKYELELLPEGYFEGYNAQCDATIFNEFAAAAFRFGHSLLKPSFKRITENLSVHQEVLLRNTFFNPEILYRPEVIDELMRGLVNTPMETFDNFITEEVTNHLFEQRRVPASGMDLAALNVQRGRDHGLPGYNAYRPLCNLRKARTFEDLHAEIPPRLVQKLRRIYQSVDDIDLFPGGLAETPVHGGLVGPTFACLIGKQFQLLRKCDRFWFENSEALTRFTPSQLNEIRKASLAKLICNNGDGIKFIQRSALDMPESFLNPRVPCETLPSIDLEFWKERVDCLVKGQNITVGKSKRTSPCTSCTCSTEGPLCQSMKVENCLHLSRSYPLAEILEDHVCLVQCALSARVFPFAFRNGTKNFAAKV